MSSRPSAMVEVARAEKGDEYASRYDGEAAFPRVCNLSVASADDVRFRNRGLLQAYARYDLAVLGTGYPLRWHAQTHPERMDVLCDNLGELRQQSPGIRILASIDACRFGGPLAEGVRDDWWVTDRRAQRVRARHPDEYLMDLSRPGWRTFVADLAERHVVGTGLFDGLLVQGASPWFPTELPGGSRVWVDLNRDGEPDTWQELNRQWRRTAADLLQEVAAVLPANMVLVAEDVGEEQASLVNGCLLPGTLDGCYRQPTLWRDAFRRYVRWARSGRQPRSTILSVTSGIDPGQQAQADTWRFDRIVAEARARTGRVRLGLCTTLLSDGYFAYDVHPHVRGEPFWFDPYNVALGYPLADAYSLPGPVWTRPYQHGQVFVNPTPKEAAVQLDRTCTVVGDPGGGREMHIGPLDGCVVVVDDAATST